MLEQLRKQSSSFIIWMLFAIIILAFVLFFGPQAGPEMFSCAGSGQIGSVQGKSIPESSWRYAMQTLGFGSDASFEERHLAVDALVERELLAQAAEDSGFRVPPEKAAEHMANGDFLLLGQKQPAPWFDDNGVLDVERMGQIARNLGLSSVDHLINEQAREHLAQFQRGALFAQGQASPDEAKARYVASNTKISLDYVRFGAARYRDAVSLDDATVSQYANALTGTLKEKWETEKDRWSAERKWTRARILFLKKNDGAKERLSSFRKQIESGTPFEVLARKHSEDSASKSRGGDLGWRASDSLGHGKELVEAVEKMGDATLTDVVETPRGFYIAKIEERHEGTLSFDQKRLDLAWEEAAKKASLQAAGIEADRALAMAQARTMDSVFEKGATPVRPQINIPPGGNLTPEQIEKIKQQLQQQMQDGAKPPISGSLWKVGPEIPVQDGGEAEATPTPAEKAAPTENAAVELPTIKLTKKVDFPNMETAGPIERSDYIAGVGTSKELVNDLFDSAPLGKISGKKYEITDPDGKPIAYALARVTDRQSADMEAFKKDQQDLVDDLRLRNGANNAKAWVQEKCKALATNKDVAIYPRYLAADPNATGGVTYAPCQMLLQQRSQF